MKTFLVYIFLFSSLFGHTQNGKLDKKDIEYIKFKKFINVCINPDWAPIEFRENGTPKGISIDILKYISKKTGLELNFIYTKSWTQSQQYLQNGRCDITPTAIKTKKRERYAIFTKPYLTYDLAIITTYDKPYVISIESIIDKTITRKKGSGLITKLKRLYPDIKILEADNFQEMLKLVSEKKVYATIATLPVFAYYKKKYNFNDLKIAGFSGMNYPLRIMIRKDLPQLQHLLDEELTFITAKFTQQVYEKWIIKTKANIDYKKLMIIIFIILFLFILVLHWVFILHKKNRELKRLSKIKSQFLANMNHELRTPLNSMMGFIEIIKKNPKESEKYISIIDSSAKVLLSIIRNILNFSRLENENIKVIKCKFYKEELFDVLEFYRSKARKKGLKLILKTENLENLFYGDIDKIRDILIHLVDNAIKFTKKGEILIVIKYLKSNLYISVKDSGIGMEQDSLKTIFKPFSQLDKRVNKEYEGIGIGLGIAQKLVEVLGGQLKVKTKIGEGSEFYFKIPIEILEEDKPKKISYEKVLIVEDNKANQIFMKVVLKKLGLDFDIADNGKIAVDLYKNFHYPLILMDINMPILDGMEATKLIRKYEKEHNLSNSKIIAVTATSIDEYGEKIEKAGFDNYISKPVDVDKLLNLI